MDEAFIAGLLTIFVFGLGAFVGFAVNSDTHHRDWCQERLAHATTSADSLAIFVDDKYCIVKEP